MQKVTKKHVGLRVRILYRPSPGVWGHELTGLLGAYLSEHWGFSLLMLDMDEGGRTGLSPGKWHLVEILPPA